MHRFPHPHSTILHFYTAKTPQWPRTSVSPRIKKLRQTVDMPYGFGIIFAMEHSTSTDDAPKLAKEGAE